MGNEKLEWLPKVSLPVMFQTTTTMNKVSRVKSRDYTTISNVFLRDNRLSLKAKGLLATIFALPDDWDFSIKGLCTIVKESTTAIYSAIDELKECGYCSFMVLRNEKGTIKGNDYTFFETPNNGERNSVIEKQQLLFDNDKVEEKKSKKDTQAIDYQAIVDCWNKYNGDAWGKVSKLTEQRKRKIHGVLQANGISYDDLIKLFLVLPFADKWLFYPNREHKNWKPDFDWWLANTNGWLTKALEGKVHKENPQAFISVMNNADNKDMYCPKGHGIYYDDANKCYGFMDMYFDGDIIYDGYNADNRPDGATLVLNNGRGNITWDVLSKRWTTNK